MIYDFCFVFYWGTNKMLIIISPFQPRTFLASRQKSLLLFSTKKLINLIKLFIYCNNNDKQNKSHKNTLKSCKRNLKEAKAYDAECRRFNWWIVKIFKARNNGSVCAFHSELAIKRITLFWIRNSLTRAIEWWSNCPNNITVFKIRIDERKN